MLPFLPFFPTSAANIHLRFRLQHEPPYPD
jgi:hypothetical protein